MGAYLHQECLGVRVADSSSLIHPPQENSCRFFRDFDMRATWLKGGCSVGIPSGESQPSNWWDGPQVGGAKKGTGELGFEPRQADPESAVLPLHHSPKSRQHEDFTAGAEIGQGVLARQIKPWRRRR